MIILEQAAEAFVAFDRSNGRHDHASTAEQRLLQIGFAPSGQLACSAWPKT